MFVKMLRLVFAALMFIEFPGASWADERNKIKACESGPVPLAVAVYPCRTAKRKDVNCLIPQGSRVLIEAAFKAPFVSRKLEMVATAEFKGREIHLPESGNMACFYINPQCPLKRGDMYQFTYQFDISKDYPASAMPMKIKIMIRERFTYEVAACATIKIVITGK